MTAVFEADFSAIAAHRAKHKDAYAKAGAPLTYSAYIVRAAARGDEGRAERQRALA